MTTSLRTVAAVAFAFVLIATASACSPGALSLTDRVFLSVGVTDGGAAKPLVANTRIRLTFGASDLGANAGCNSIGGTYRLDGGRLVFEGASMTEMGCDLARHAQDDWLVAFLASRPVIRLVGNDLTLEGGSTVVRLLDREVADPDLNIVGPTWTVESLIEGDAVSSVPEGANATLLFKADGSVEVDAGCNRGSGTWKLEGTGLRIESLILTKMACAGAAAMLEGAVLGVLEAGALQAQIEANVLTLSGGNSGLQLRG